MHYVTQHKTKLDRKTLVDKTWILYRMPDKNRRVTLEAILIGKYNSKNNTQAHHQYSIALRYMDRHQQQHRVALELTDSVQHRLEHSSRE